MNIHHYVFKILEKTQSVTDGWMDTWMDGHQNNIPHHKQKFAGGITNETNEHITFTNFSSHYYIIINQFACYHNTEAVLLTSAYFLII